MDIKSTLRYLTNIKCFIAFLDNTLDDVMTGKPLNIRCIKHDYTDRWFADPYILDVTETQIILLVEEFMWATKKGRIAKLTIDRDTLRLVQNVIVLDLPTHLSFPVIRRDGDTVYIYPENGASESLNLYKFDNKSNTCIKVQELAKGELYDFVITDDLGEQMMFATMGHSHDEANGNRLCLFRRGANGIFENPEYLYLKENTARMAGDFFTYKGKLYRPAQENNSDFYGHGLSIQKVTNNNGSVQLTEVRHIESNCSKGPDGIHTFNSYKDVIVVDVLADTPKWAKIIKGLLH